MLAELVDHVIGVDTHKHTNTAAIVTAATAEVIETTAAGTDPDGYQCLLDLAERCGGLRAWAIEGANGYGAGLARFLAERGEWVIELDRPERAKRRHGAKSDPIDAVRAAREALSREHLSEPRAEGERAALSVRLAARIVSCLRQGVPYELRDVDGTPITDAEGRAIVNKRYRVPDDVRAARRSISNARSANRRDERVKKGVAEHSETPPAPTPP